MRMWMINPKLLCNQHLLGEHGEIHKHRHSFMLKHDMSGRVNPVVHIEPLNMKRRHDQLAAEMLRRDMNHQSPFEQPDVSYLPIKVQTAKVDHKVSKHDLIERCDKCAELIQRSLI